MKQRETHMKHALFIDATLSFRCLGNLIKLQFLFWYFIFHAYEAKYKHDAVQWKRASVVLGGIFKKWIKIKQSKFQLQTYAVKSVDLWKGWSTWRGKCKFLSNQSAKPRSYCEFILSWIFMTLSWINTTLVMDSYNSCLGLI